MRWVLLFAGMLVTKRLHAAVKCKVFESWRKFCQGSESNAARPCERPLFPLVLGSNENFSRGRRFTITNGSRFFTSGAIFRATVEVAESATPDLRIVGQ